MATEAAKATTVWWFRVMGTVVLKGREKILFGVHGITDKGKAQRINKILTSKEITEKEAGRLVEISGMPYATPDVPNSHMRSAEQRAADVEAERRQLDGSKTSGELSEGAEVAPDEPAAEDDESAEDKLAAIEADMKTKTKTELKDLLATLGVEIPDGAYKAELVTLAAETVAAGA